MIEISSLTKYQGKKTVISNVSFSAQRQECLGLFGMEGAGKTTLLKMIAGSLRPSSGQVNILGFDPQIHAHQARMDLGGETICEEKRMDGTIKVALSMAGDAGAEVPSVITFITNAFLIITE